MRQVESARPRKRRVWLSVRILLLFALYIVVGLLPAVSIIPVSAVPPLADMQVSEGTISTRSVTKAGSLTILTASDGRKNVFSCRENAGGSHSCIHPRYEGEFGQIHWFPVRMPLAESRKFAAQIVVNGKVVRERSTVIERLKETRVIFQFMYGPLAFIVFFACVFVMVAPKGTTTDAAVKD